MILIPGEPKSVVHGSSPGIEDAWQHPPLGRSSFNQKILDQTICYFAEVWHKCA